VNYIKRDDTIFSLKSENNNFVMGHYIYISFILLIYPILDFHLI